MRKINTEDVFKAARLLKNGNIMQNIRDAYAAGKVEGADAEEVGLNAIMDILCSCSESKVETQFYDLLAGICEKKPDEIKTQSFETTIGDIKKICEENDIVNFLNAASRLNQKISG